MAGKETQARVTLKVKSCCENDSGFQKHSSYLIEKAQTGDSLFVVPIIDTIKKIIKDKKEPPSVKFHALHLLKQCMDKKSKPLQAYVAKKILKRLKDFAKEANKGQGESVFGSKSSDASSSRKFSQLLLECISEWAVTYAMGDNPMEVTKYKQIYTELIKSKVRFPTTLTYFQKKPPENIPKPSQAPKLDESSAGVRNSMSSQMAASSKKDNKPATTTNVNKPPKDSFRTGNDPTVNKPPVLIKPVEIPQGNSSTSQNKKPENKPSTADNPVSKAREAIDTLKNIIPLLFDAEEMVIDDVVDMLKPLAKYITPEKIEELIMKEEVLNDEKFVGELFALSEPAQKIILSYEKFKKGQITLDRLRAIAVEIFNQNQEILMQQPTIPKSKAVKSVDDRGKSAPKFEEKKEKPQISKKPSLTDPNNNFGFEKPSAGLPQNSRKPSYSEQNINNFGFENSSAGLQKNQFGQSKASKPEKPKTDFENPFGGVQNNNANAAFDQFGKASAMESSGFKNNFQNPEFEFQGKFNDTNFDNGMNQFGPQFNNNFNNADPFATNFNSNNFDPKSQFESNERPQKPTLRKKESNTSNQPPSSHELPSAQNKLKKKESITSNQQHPSSNNLQGKPASKQELFEDNKQNNDFGGGFGNPSSFVGFNEFMGGKGGTDFTYMTNFEGNPQKNPFNNEQKPEGFDGFGSSSGLPGFEPPQFQFDLGGDHEFSNTNTANHSFKEDDNPFKASKEIEGSNPGFNFNFGGGSEVQDWSNFNGPFEPNQMRPDPDFIQNRWQNPEGKEEIKENEVPEQENAGEGWGNSTDWNFGDQKAQEHGLERASPQFLGGNQFSLQNKKNVNNETPKNDPPGKENWENGGWGNEEQPQKWNEWNGEPNKNQNVNQNLHEEPQKWGTQTAFDPNNFEETKKQSSQNWDNMGFNNDISEPPQRKNKDLNSQRSISHLSQPENEFSNQLGPPKEPPTNWDLSVPNPKNQQGSQTFPLEQNPSKSAQIWENNEGNTDFFNDFGSDTLQKQPNQNQGFVPQEQNPDFFTNFNQPAANNDFQQFSPNILNKSVKNKDFQEFSQNNGQNILSQNNLNVSHQTSNSRVFHRQPSQTSVKILNEQPIFAGNEFPGGGVVQYPSLPNPNVFNQVSLDNNQMDFTTPNQEFNFNQGLGPMQMNNNGNLMEGWGKEMKNNDGWVDFSENAVSENLSVPPVSIAKKPSPSGQLNSIFGNLVSNPLVKPVDNQSNLLDFDDMIPTNDNPNVPFADNLQSNQMDFTSKQQNNFPLGSLDHAMNQNNFQDPKQQSSFAGFQYPTIQESKPQGSMAGYQYPTVNPKDLMAFDSERNSKIDKANNLVSSAHLPEKDGAPSDFQSNKQRQLYAFLDTMNDEMGENSAQQNQIKESKVTKSLIPNDPFQANNIFPQTNNGLQLGNNTFPSNINRNNMNNNDFLMSMTNPMTATPQNNPNMNFPSPNSMPFPAMNNNVMEFPTKPESSKLIIDEFKKEREELMWEMKKLRQSYEGLKEDFEKSIKAKEVQTPQLFLQQDSIKENVLSPFFPQGAQPNQQIEETRILKQTVESLTEEIKALKNSLNNSPNKQNLGTPRSQNENPMMTMSPVRMAKDNMSVNESFTNIFEPERLKPPAYSYTTVFRRKQPINQNNNRSNCSIVGNLNFYTISIDRKNTPYTNSFLLEKPRSLNNSFLMNTNRKNFHKENVISEEENRPHWSFDLQKGEGNRTIKVNSRIREWREFLRMTNSSEILQNIDNFKYCCLNKRGVLFENDVFQIGVVCDFDLKQEVTFSLYFGNKSDEDIQNCDLSLLEATRTQSKAKVSGLKEVIKAKSQIIVEVHFPHGSTPCEKTFIDFLYRFDNENQKKRIPLPNTLNKFIDFGFIAENVFKEKLKSLEHTHIVSSEEICLNPRFIERIEDFQRFFPEMKLLPSNKLKGSFMRNKKLGGVINWEGNEVLLRIVMNYERQAMFQIGIEKSNLRIKELAEDLIDTFCFLFGNI